MTTTPATDRTRAAEDERDQLARQVTSQQLKINRLQAGEPSETEVALTRKVEDLQRQLKRVALIEPDPRERDRGAAAVTALREANADPRARAAAGGQRGAAGAGRRAAKVQCDAGQRRAAGMMQVQVSIELIPDGDSRIFIHQLAREDATADERAYAQAIEDLLKSIMTRVHAENGDELTWTEIQPREEPS